MYQDLRKSFWRYGMKKEVVKYVEKCLTCQKSKAEHQRMSIVPNRDLKFTSKFWGSRQGALGTKLKLNSTHHPQTVSYHASIGMVPYTALYGRKCRTPLCWYKAKEAILYASDLVQQQNDQVKMIRENIEVA
ncbi:uncharacterized protein LOC113870043 [Abrus precatorius]|uniref:Uncharacterized protein LOC113870043 n=1 Tax=Abrus precatorius TaxID=3816 RepID=A0A8B8M3Z7_ABRPR|nr:uncharacterized protein LOC113870043 [Abrus precatorius]